MKRTLLAITAAIITLSFASCKKEEPAEKVHEGDALPAFTVTMSDGTTFNSAVKDEKGGTLIIFFSTMCQQCQDLLPDVQLMYNSYKDWVNIVPISREQSTEQLSTYWKIKDFTFPYSGQDDRAVYEFFANSGIPRAYFAQDGKIVKAWSDTDTFNYSVVEAYFKEALGPGIIVVM